MDDTTAEDLPGTVSEQRVGAVIVRAVRLEPTLGALSAPHLAGLSDTERGRYATFAPSSRATSFAVGRLHLRNLVGSMLGIAPDDIRLETRCPHCGGAHGQVTVANSAAGPQGVGVSIAHSPGMVVVAAARGRRLGVDVESITDLGASDPRNPHRLEHWTRIEAVLKADGRGLTLDPESVWFREAPRGLRAGIDRVRARYRVIDLDTEPGYYIALAVGHRARTARQHRHARPDEPGIEQRPQILS